MGTEVSVRDHLLESGETIHLVLPLVGRTEAEGEIKQFFNLISGLGGPSCIALVSNGYFGIFNGLRHLIDCVRSLLGHFV